MILLSYFVTRPEWPLGIFLAGQECAYEPDIIRGLAWDVMRDGYRCCYHFGVFGMLFGRLKVDQELAHSRSPRSRLKDPLPVRALLHLDRVPAEHSTVAPHR